MKITVSNIIKIENASNEIIDYCKRHLTFKNPEYDKKKRMGLWIYKTPKEIKLYDKYDNDIYLPIGCFNDIWKIDNNKDDYKDYTTVKGVDVVSHIKLRDYQKPCIQAIRKYINGIFILPTGTGKTNIALECFANLKQKTLWLTHTKDLLNQAKERCTSNIDCKVSEITDGKCDYSGDIVFATIQTLVGICEKKEIPPNTFGMVICDEVHRACINAENISMFEKCINYFNARYKLGLTATLKRADGLHRTTLKLLGDVLYEVKKKGNKLVGIYENEDVIELDINNFQVQPVIHIEKTDFAIEKYGDEIFDRTGRIVYTKLITQIALEKDRNSLILNILSKLNGYTLIISERTKQLEYLHSKIENSIYINGSTNKKIREKNIQEFKDGKHKVMLASYQLVSEGLDIPILNNLIMATPVKDERLVIQSIGRIQRPSLGKTICDVYDLSDSVSILQGFLRKRKSIYKKQEWEIKS